MIERQMGAMREGADSVPLVRGDVPQVPSTPQGRVAALERQLAEARLMYTDKHPEVVRLQEELKRARSEAAAERARPESDRITTLKADPTYRQLLADQENGRMRVRELQRAETQIRAQINAYQQRVEGSPLVEQQLTSLQRDYDLEKKQYEELSARRDAAALSEDLERRQAGERFRVLSRRHLAARAVPAERLPHPGDGARGRRLPRRPRRPSAASSSTVRSTTRTRCSTISTCRCSAKSPGSGPHRRRHEPHPANPRQGRARRAHEAHRRARGRGGDPAARRAATGGGARRRPSEPARPSRAARSPRPVAVRPTAAPARATAAPPPAPAPVVVSPLVTPTRISDAKLGAAWHRRSPAALAGRRAVPLAAHPDLAGRAGTLLPRHPRDQPRDGDGKSVTVAQPGAHHGAGVPAARPAGRRRPAATRRSTGCSAFRAGPGSADVLVGAATLDEAMVTLADYRLTVLPAGSPVDRPTELLGSAEMRRLVDTLRTRFDRVIFDTPPAVAARRCRRPRADGRRRASRRPRGRDAASRNRSRRRGHLPRSASWASS